MSKVPTINIEELAKQAGIDLEGNDFLRSQLRIFAAFTLVEAANVLHEKAKDSATPTPVRGGLYSGEAAILRLANRMKGQ